MKIKTDRLGVILDDSWSMHMALPLVVADIKDSFPGAFFTRVNGCKLEECGNGKSLDDVISRVEKGARRHGVSFDAAHEYSVEDAIVGLVLEDNVDAIYWYTDLADGGMEGAIATICGFLKSHGVRFYIRSVVVNVEPEEAPEILSTGGDVEWPGREKALRRQERQ